MSKELSIGNQLYFYQLFSRELGIGKQTLIARVDEVLEKNNMNLSELDLDCQTTQELLELMPTCIKLTIFKGGRVYATVLRVPEWDEALEKSSKSTGKEGKSFKRKKSSTLKPVRPRIKRKKPTPISTEQPVANNEAHSDEPADITASIEEVIAHALLEEIQSSSDESEDVQECDELDVDPEDSVVTIEDVQEEPADEEVEDTPIAPVAPEPPHPHLTITYDPSKDANDPFTSASAIEVDETPSPEDVNVDIKERELVPDFSEQSNVDPSNDDKTLSDSLCVTARDISHRYIQQSTNTTLPATYPINFTDEVNCNSQILGLLNRYIPFGSSLAQILNEDWDYACATGAVSGTSTRASFPLRYVHEDGVTPVYLTIHRTRQLRQKAQWSLILIDGKGPNELEHKSVCFAGLPQANASSFEQLSPCTCLETPCSPERIFAGDCTIGFWDTFLSELAELAAPERWSFDDTTQPYGILREYICATYLRAKQQQILYVSDEKNQMAFNTGLFTLGNEAIYAWFNANDTSIPWKFDSFKIAATCSESLDGAQLTAASYIESLNQISIAPTATLTVNTKNILSRSLLLIPFDLLKQELTDDEGARSHLCLLEQDNLTAPERDEIASNLAHYLIQSAKLFRRFDQILSSAAQNAFTHAKSNYRSIATAFDPSSSDVKMLIPLGLLAPHLSEVALVISCENNNTPTYTAESLMSLSCAYVCARTTAQDMPSWLSF